MSLPTNASTGRITAQFLAVDGTPCTGKVFFFPSPDRLLDSSEKVTFVPNPVTADLDSNGRLSVDLLATDDPDVSPVGYTWRAVHNINALGVAHVLEDISFSVPAGTSQDLATLAAVSESKGTPDPAWLSMARSTVSGGHVTSDGELVLDKADGTTVTVGSVLDPVKAPVSVDISNGAGGLVRLTRMDRIVVGSIITAPSNIGSGSSYTFGKVPLGFRPINLGSINELTIGAAFNANTSKMTGAWQFINLEGAIDHSLALFTNEANGFWIGSIIWATNDAYPTS